MDDLRQRLANRVQLTTDGHRAYLQAVEEAFGDDIDYAMLVKLYGATTDPEHRYSPAECIDTRKTKITGNPDRDHVSTSYVERQNLTMRMSMRRFTRLTHAHSKKLENHHHAQALYFMFYNFARINSAVKMSPHGGRDRDAAVGDGGYREAHPRDASRKARPLSASNFKLIHYRLRARLDTPFGEHAV
jgi:hypothetical protein